MMDYLSVFDTAIAECKLWVELGHNSSVTCGQSCKRTVGVAPVQSTPSDAYTTSLCTTILSQRHVGLTVFSVICDC